MVPQVTVVAILMIIQGALEAIVGLLLIVAGPVIFTLLTQAAQQQPGGQAPPKEMAGIMGAVYIGLGAVVLIAGGLKIFAGIKNLKYRGRTLGIVALVSGVVPLCTCYCAPTALGLMIYGLIVYLNADVARAFEMGERGTPPEQIKASFDRMGPGPGQPPYAPPPASV